MDEISKQKILNILDCTNVQNSNANVDEYSFGGRKFEAAGVLLKDIAREKYISPEVWEAFKQNRIYIHDMDNYAIGMHNCCRRDTKFITDKGVYSFNDFNDGDEVIVKTHNNNWKKAKVLKLGKQMLNKITLCRGHNIQEEYFTANHRWILADGSITENIKLGDKLYKAPTYTIFNFDTATENEKKMWCVGFILGDGVECNRWSHGKKTDEKYIRLRLCGNKIKYVENFNILNQHIATLENGDLYLTFSSLSSMHKQLPDLSLLSITEKQALFEGLYAADGNHTGTNMAITTTSEEVASFIEDIVPSLGYYILQNKDLTGKETNFGKRGFTKQYNFIQQSNKYYWTVIDIEKYQEEDVWCLDVEDDHSFILPNGVVTGNCLFVDFEKLFKEGFSTRNGDVRPPKSISTAMQQVAVIFQCQSQVQFGK